MKAIHLLPKKKRLLSLTSRINKGLFSSPIDTSITILFISLIIIGITKTTKWFLYYADWSVVTNNISLYLVGLYPENLHWRPLTWLTFISLSTFISIFLPLKRVTSKFLTILWTVTFCSGLFLLGGGFGVQQVSTREWGGLSLTIILALCSAVLALPIGIILALARQSKLLLIKKLSGIYIDLIRSVPLISVLFFGQLLIPLFLPMELEISRFMRAVIAFSLFASAYIAEDIRGGLQSIPKTQREASLVLGFSPIQSVFLIVLPQALKTAIPALTNQAVGLLQNTSLMAILGLMEILGVSRSILANPEYIGGYLEVYLWLAITYWLVCTGIALISKNIEKRANPELN